MIKTGMFLPGHRPAQHGRAGPFSAIVAAAAGIGIALGSALAALALRTLL